MTERKHLSTTARLRIFEAAKGVCHLCGLKITAGQEWDVSHAIPLAIGGPDDETNRLPAHRRCHRQHTAEVDAPRIAKTKRQHAAHIGAKAPSSTPLPFGRNSRLKRKLNGTIVER
jgi:hypothetical protein